ncbi:MAG: hypothetical protein ACYDAH_19705 [Steroidobacteraceae bacterium]
MENPSRPNVGSLPRTEELKQLMFAREDGLPFDPSALDEQVSRAVESVVARQLKVGARHHQRRRKARMSRSTART